MPPPLVWLAGNARHKCRRYAGVETRGTSAAATREWKARHKCRRYAGVEARHKCRRYECRRYAGFRHLHLSFILYPLPFAL